MESVKIIQKSKYNKIDSIYMFLLLMGTTLRIPISSSTTISLTEILLLLTIIMLPGLRMHKKLKFSKIEIKLIPLIIVISSLLFIQILIHFNRTLSIILLFEYLFIGIVLFFIFNRINFSYQAHFKSLVIFSLYLGITSIYFNVFNYETGQVVSLLRFGSVNYTSAIMLIMIPVIYLYINQKKSTNWSLIASFAIFVMVVSIIFSGSRSNIIALIFQLLYFIFFIQKSFIGKLKIILGLLFIALFAYNVVNLINPELFFVIERYILFFSNSANARNDILYSDIARNNLKAQAMVLIKANLLWGTGFARILIIDMPVHNFIYEILLGLGLIGLITYLFYVVYFLTLMYKNILKRNIIRKIYIMLVVSFFLISWVHPFMTTGKEFTFIFWLNIIGLYKYSEEKKRSSNLEI